MNTKYTNYFEGRTLLIATQHGKEQVIAPIFEKNLGLQCTVPEHFDTDAFGTFAGEIERTDDALTTLRKKCTSAMKHYQADLVIASEGSFGAHPESIFLPADEELLMFIDQRHGLEVVERTLSTQTNFSGATVNSQAALEQFAKRALFPSHALILRPTAHSTTHIIKGITAWETLYCSYDRLVQQFGEAYVATDMRALYNPSRMEVIKQITQKLLQRLQTHCPQCHIPGFGVTARQPGLPCAYCGAPTRSTLVHIQQCAKCKYLQEQLYPHHKTAEDPRYCDYCNP